MSESEPMPGDDIPQLNALGQLLRQLAEVLIRKIETDLKGQMWQHAVLDVRYAQEGSSWLDKIRVVTSRQGTVSVGMSNEIIMLLISLNSMRGIQKDEWYGLMMTIDSNHQCNT